ncbi:hypothetical protein F66182_10475 [Fusarium sp. NRRL 66182]|nr:hypothetical protein F66182_10475 [Fusarium sp. NRRL 66182]
MPAGVISGPFVGPSKQKTVAERIATTLYSSTCRSPKTQTQTQTTRAVATNTSADASQLISVVCISDTHNTFPSPLPMGDILVHAGDLSQYGTFAEVQAQLKWLASQPHPYKVVIAGNHDLILDSNFVSAHPDRELNRPGQSRSDLDWGGIHYLEHDYIDLCLKHLSRTIRIFGSPWTPRFGNFAFQYGPEADVFSWKASIPPRTDLMLVHGPPKGHLDDGGRGCPALLAELWRAKPKVVVCGHIHAGRGEQDLFFDRIQANYEAVVMGTKPWPSLFSLALCYTWHKLGTFIGLSPRNRQVKDTHLVNATMVRGRGGNGRLDAVVVNV